MRDFELDDLEYFTRTMSNPDVTLHVGGPNDREDAFRKMMSGSAFWRLTGIGMWAVERKDDRQTIGHLGFFDFQREMQPSIAGKPEMGWIFAPGGQGQGFASESAQAALAWFDDKFGRLDIWALISPGNYASMKLAARLGFERKADGAYRDRAQTMWLRAA